MIAMEKNNSNNRGNFRSVSFMSGKSAGIICLPCKNVFLLNVSDINPKMPSCFTKNKETVGMLVYIIDLNFSFQMVQHVTFSVLHTRRQYEKVFH